MTFADRVRALVDNGHDRDDIPNEIFSYYRDHPGDLDELRGVIAHEVSTILSHMRRDVEDAVFITGEPVVTRTPRSTKVTGRVNVKAAAVAQRNPTIERWLAMEVPLADGSHVTWGEMTAAQHQQRQQDLYQQIDSLNTTYQRHVFAERVIRQYRVHCLNELALDVAQRVYDAS